VVTRSGDAETLTRRRVTFQVFCDIADGTNDETGVHDLQAQPMLAKECDTNKSLICRLTREDSSEGEKYLLAHVILCEDVAEWLRGCAVSLVPTDLFQVTTTQIDMLLAERGHSGPRTLIGRLDPHRP
jgi:hypothetical protein